MEQTTANREPRTSAGAMAKQLIANGATAKVHAHCGCGWKLVSAEAGDVVTTIHRAIEHAAATGHTAQFQGEVRRKERA